MNVHDHIKERSGRPSSLLKVVCRVANRSVTTVEFKKLYLLQKTWARRAMTENGKRNFAPLNDAFLYIPGLALVRPMTF